MYNLIPFLIFQKQLKDNGIKETPPGLLLSFVTGSKVPMLHQVIMNKAVVDSEIAKKDKLSTANRLNSLQTDIDTATGQLDPTKPGDFIDAVKRIRTSAGLPEIQTANSGGAAPATNSAAGGLVSSGAAAGTGSTGGTGGTAASGTSAPTGAARRRRAGAGGSKGAGASKGSGSSTGTTGGTPNP